MRTLILLALLLPLGAAEQGIAGSFTIVVSGGARPPPPAEVSQRRVPMKAQAIVVYRGAIPKRTTATSEITAPVAAKAVTGDDGRFRVELPPGEYTVTVAIDGMVDRVSGATRVDTAGHLSDAVAADGNRPTVTVVEGTWATCDMEGISNAAP